MKTKRAVLLLLAIVLVAAACSPAPSTSANPDAAVATPLAGTPGTYQTLSVDELANILANQPDAYTILNVHIPYAGEIAGTDANVPYIDLDALMAALPDKNAPVILYCRSGNMSEQAAHDLLAQGYTQVWDVSGGMAAWQASGRDLIDTQ